MCPEITITDADAKAVTAKAIKPPMLNYCPICGSKLVVGGKTFINKNGSTLVANTYCSKCNHMADISISAATS